MKKFYGIFQHLRQVSPAYDQPIQREHWAREITGSMAIVIGAATLIVFAGVLGGFYTLEETLPVYILLAIIAPTAWVARYRKWQWVGYVPSILCFTFASFGVEYRGFHTLFVIYYALAVLTAGMLKGPLYNWAVTCICVISYFILGMWQAGGFTPANLVDASSRVITFSFGLIGISILQGYYDYRLYQTLSDYTNSNQALKAEIARREEAETSQREQEIQLRRLADNMGDMVAELDVNGCYRYVSPSHFTVLGYTPEDLLGMNVLDLIHPDDLAMSMGAIQSQLAVRIVIRVRHAEKHYVSLEVSGSPLEDENGEIIRFVITGRNITAQKQIESALQESEKKFRNIIEMLPLGIHIFTIQDNGKLCLTGYNRAADVMLGIDHAALIYAPIETCLPGLTGKPLLEEFCSVALNGGGWKEEQFEYIDERINGVFAIQAFQTSPGNIVVVFDNISDRIRASQALLHSEEKFSKAFHTSPDSVNINRLMDGVYIDINQGFTKIMGYTHEDVIGKSSLALDVWVDPADRGRLVKGLLEIGEVQNLEARFRRKNGEVLWGLMSARVIIMNGEKCILSITRDINQWVIAQAELRETHKKLEQAYEATLEGWALALELRERETGDHSRRVVDLTLQVARHLGIADTEIPHFARGALLHDIGKVGVPDSILLKPSALTPDEWVIMRQHAENAHALLKDIEYLRPAIDIPYCHHERWDGNGYPRGLKGTEIPLSARIFAVVDVYDALLSKRPYRPAWGESDVHRYLLEQKGKQFDPEIVDAFFQLIDRLEKQ